MGRATDKHALEDERRDRATKIAAANLLVKVGAKLEKLDRWIDDPPDGETYIQSIKFKVNAAWDGGILAIVLATRGGEKVKAFHSDDSLLETVAGLAGRLDNGSLKWTEDKPYEDRKAAE